MSKDATTLVYDGVKFEVMEITPKQAQRWIERHNKVVITNEYKQRKSSSNDVRKLRNKFLQGLWRYTGDPIRIAKNGFVIDGQTRIEMIANLPDDEGPVISMVATGFPDELILYLDQGRKRTVRHQFETKGFGDDSRYITVICKSLFMIAHNSEKYTGGGDEADILRIQHIEPLYADIIRPIIDIAESGRKSKGIPHMWSAPFVSAMALICRANREVGISFMREAVFGENLTAKMPAFVLRNRLINLKSDKRIQPTQEIFFLTLLAAKKYFEGKEVETLQSNVKGALIYFKNLQIEYLQAIRNGEESIT